MAEKTKVTRIKAADSKPAAKVAKSSVGAKPKRQKRSNILGKIGGYFKGAWYELKQVHWPTRRATWSLTFAVLLFSAFFVALVILLDLGFQNLFELIIK